MRVHLFLMTTYAITATDAYTASPPPSETQHSISQTLYPEGHHTALPPEAHRTTPETHGHHTALPPEAHNNTAETHGGHLTALAPEAHKTTSETHGSLSQPKVNYTNLVGNTMHITCFSESGRLPIQYRLFLHNLMLGEKVVSRSEPANFIVPMTPRYGKLVYFNCKATSATGETSSSNLTIPAVMDESTVPAEEAKSDQKDTETGPKHLIPVQHILTSVTPEVLRWNTLVLITCGPIIILFLVIVLIFTYLRGKNKQYMEAGRTF